jgi:hypothetical protein
MSTTPDNPPAFPGQWLDFQPITGEQVVREQWSGLSMRDYFAANALSLMSNHEILLTVDKCFPEDSTRVAIAKYAYGVADSMLAEREKGASK